MPSASLIAAIAREAEAVEAELRAQVTSQVGLVDSVLRHTLGAGGKRLRPAFVSVCARATGLPYDESRARSLGACMEMIHMATLIHDDVIDNAGLRRGAETAASMFGNCGAILSGDVLLAKAMAILACDGDLEIIRTVSQAVVEMSEGEVRELELRGSFDVRLADHLEVLRMKTASFIQCCCLVGAMAAGADGRIRKALSEFGHHVGMAFQIADDLLDYEGDSARTGKAQATDFREGCATLPLICLSAKLTEDERVQIRGWFGNGATDQDLRGLVSLMKERGALREARLTAEQHAHAAREALSAVPETHAKELLLALCEYSVRRSA